MEDMPGTAGGGPVEDLAALEREAAQADCEGAAGEYMEAERAASESDEKKRLAIAQTAEVIAPLLAITFGLVASRRGPHWQLADLEAQTAAEAYAAVIVEHWPEVTIGPELAAIMVTLAIVGPRVREDKRRGRERVLRPEGKPPGDKPAAQPAAPPVPPGGGGDGGPD